jgi:hypothetical protein
LENVTFKRISVFGWPILFLNTENSWPPFIAHRLSFIDKLVTGQKLQ